MDGLDGRRRAGIDSRLRFISRGSIKAALFNLGPYPGARPDPVKSVHGELYELIGAEALEVLDEFEGYRPSDPEAGPYRRVETGVRLTDGGVRQAWVYLYFGSLDAAESIASGDYRDVTSGRCEP